MPYMEHIACCGARTCENRFPNLWIVNTLSADTRTWVIVCLCGCHYLFVLVGVCQRLAVSFWRLSLEFCQQTSAIVNNALIWISKQPNFAQCITWNLVTLLNIFALLMCTAEVFVEWKRSNDTSIRTFDAKRHLKQCNSYKWRTITIPIKHVLKLKQLT